MSTPGKPGVACQMSSHPGSLSAGVKGEWSVATVSIVPSRKPSHSASLSAFVFSGGLHLAYGPCSTSEYWVSARYCGHVSAVTLTPRRLPSRMTVTASADDTCGMCRCAPAASARRISVEMASAST